MSMEFTTIADHAARAVGRMRQMNGPRMRAFASTLGAQCQIIENVFSNMVSFRYLANATGITLDSLGALRNVPRQGLSDAIYRNVILGAIAAQTSKGTKQSVINAALGLFSAQEVFVKTPNSTSVTSASPAVVSVGIGSGVLPLSALGLSLNLLNQSLGAGIAIDQLFSFNASGAFAMSGPAPWVQGLNQGGLGADVYTNPTD